MGAELAEGKRMGASTGMKQVRVKDIVGLLEGGAKSNPTQRDYFVMHMRGIGFIPGLVVKDDFKYGDENIMVIYIYNEICADKDGKFKMDKENLIVPPALMTKMDWRANGGFETVGRLKSVEMDVFPDHCFYDDLRMRYINGEKKICEKFEPCGIYAISNIGAEAVGIYEKLNPGVRVIE
ncbi:hypothetical protein L3V59_28875 [Burkholderia aenigmatica]|uniref:hypothetical protein n=1 Tax=Burkholderia aenigmatica TaxID=2015348 RepID=UPI001F1E6373|nr:hypothetical protein [Burkholderia aenigmatica]UKD13712.1 hypothetical protein L3V59_28875 [Burkholderia aenigmatica]